MSETYGFYNVEVIIDGKEYMCSGEVEFEYEPGEPDEKWGHHGATPGYGPEASSIYVTCMDEVSWEDDKGVLHTDMNDFPMDDIKADIESHFDDNQDELIDSVEK